MVDEIRKAIERGNGDAGGRRVTVRRERIMVEFQGPHMDKDTPNLYEVPYMMYGVFVDGLDWESEEARPYIEAVEEVLGCDWDLDDGFMSVYVPDWTNELGDEP